MSAAASDVPDIPHYAASSAPSQYWNQQAPYSSNWQQQYIPPSYTVPPSHSYPIAHNHEAHDIESQELVSGGLKHTGHLSRRAVVAGLLGATVVAVGGGVTLLALSHNAPGSVSQSSLLYTADWSNGLNGWVGTSDWSVVNAMLHSDGTDSTNNSPTMVAPYQVEGISDYAVEIRIQVVAAAACFDVTTIRASGSGTTLQGYKATICGGATINVGNTNGDPGIAFDTIAQASFSPGNSWRTYRFEAKGTKLTLLVDGTVLLETNSSRYLTGGKLGFKSYETQLNISSFKVFAL